MVTNKFKAVIFYTDGSYKVIVKHKGGGDSFVLADCVNRIERIFIPTSDKDVDIAIRVFRGDDRPKSDILEH